MKKSLKKIFALAVIALNLFSLSTPIAYGASFSLSNPLGVMNSIFSSLGVNKSELQYAVKSFNVSRRKKTPPSLSLTFEPANPVPGEKVIVTATPTYFMNATEDLYFTWYLKNKRCFDKELDGSDYKSKFAQGDFAKCDLNESGEVNIEDYKIKAMRLLANNDFDWENADYSKDTDDDGYRAISGGADQVGKDSHCFVHNIESGDEYEITCGHLFPNSPSDTTGDDSFSSSEEEFWHTNPKNKDTAQTGKTDEANVVGLGKNVFSFTYTAGDQIGVVVEGVSIEPTQYADASYRTMWAFTKNKCDITSGSSGYPKIGTPSVVTQLNTPSENYTTTITTTETESVVSDTQVNDLASIRTTTSTRTLITYTDPDTQETTTTSDSTETSRTCSQEEIEQGVTCSGADAINQIITTSTMSISDLNNCLYENFVTPAEGGELNEKLEVALSSLPENPLNDPSGNGNGDILSFNASVTNANNASYLNYAWEVFAGDETDSDEWGNPIPKNKLSEPTQTSGLGIKTLSFKLNFKPTDFSPVGVKKYLKVRVTVKETLSEGGEREGHADIIVPISSSEERIKVYTAKVTDGKIDLPAKKNSADLKKLERCVVTSSTTNTLIPQAVCEIAKNEIIAVSIDNGTDSASSVYTDFLWTVDGETQTCPDTSFEDCLDANGRSTAQTYFPVLKNSGDNYTVNLSALNKNTGERLELTRVFSVSTPEIKIVPQEKNASGEFTCRGLLLGNYLDFNDKTYEDRSDSEFQALTNHEIELLPAFFGAIGQKSFATPKDYPYKWNVDGVTIDAQNSTNFGYSIDLANYGKLILPPKNIGEKYRVSLSTIFTPTNAMRQVLNKHWGVTYDEFYEKKLKDQVEIEMVSTEIAQKENSSQKIFATVSSGIPSYISFLFRIALSGAAIILAMKIIFFVLPKRQF